MNVIVTKGLNPFMSPFKIKPLVVRIEKTNNYVTMSIEDEDEGQMLKVFVDDKLKKALKEVLVCK